MGSIPVETTTITALRGQVAQFSFIFSLSAACLRYKRCGKRSLLLFVDVGSPKHFKQSLSHEIMIRIGKVKKRSHTILNNHNFEVRIKELKQKN